MTLQPSNNSLRGGLEVPVMEMKGTVCALLRIHLFNRDRGSNKKIKKISDGCGHH